MAWLHSRIPAEVWAEAVLQILDARDVLTLLDLPDFQQTLPRAAAFIARRPMLASEWAWFADRGIAVRSTVPDKYAVDTAKEDFDRFSHFHSWYKHLSLSPHPSQEVIVTRRRAQQQNNHAPVEDKVGYHWYMNVPFPGSMPKKLRVHVNFFLMRTWERYGTDDDYHDGRKRYITRPNKSSVFHDRGGGVFLRYMAEINALIANKYPHLPPFSAPAPESLHAVMRLEFDRMYREFLAAAQQCMDDDDDAK